MPSIVRSRIPLLPSLRQFARDVVARPVLHLRTRSAQEYTAASTPSVRDRSDCNNSVFATYSATSSGTSSPRPASPEGDELALASAARYDLSLKNEDIQAGGVDWIIAGAGVRLWLNARGHAELATRDPELLRAMHIDALKYMNMALPTNLSLTEIETIQASLPSQISQSQENHRQITMASQPNKLRQGVAQAVCWIIALILVMIPLVMTAINKLLIIEREHQITQRAFNSGANLAKALSERGLDFGDAFVRFRDTPFGTACFDVMSWFIEGVAGGMNDALLQSTSGSSVMLKQRS